MQSCMVRAKRSPLYCRQSTLLWRSCRACSTKKDATERRKRGYWQVAENRKAFVNTFEKEHGIRDTEGWRRVTVAQLRASGGGGLVTRYRGSMVALLRHEVEGMDGVEVVQLRKRVPNGYWKSRQHRRAFMDDAAKALGVKHRSDWRNVAYADICALGGSRLLNEFGDSLSALLLDTYGQGNHHTPGAPLTGSQDSSDDKAALVGKDLYRWRNYVPREYWQDSSNVRAFLEFVSAKVGIRDEGDWLRLSMREIQALGGSGLLREMTLSEALRKAFPDQHWQALDAGTLSKRARQRRTRVVAERAFPSCTVLEEHRVSGASTSLGGELVLDIYLPEISLAIEYNGEQHYHEVPIFGPLEVIQRRDREKAEACAKQGIRLFTVPYWWDGETESLLASLHRQYPTVLPSLVPSLSSGASATQ